ncbi:hypothetical protein BVC93_11965 [Mycobacterium sp. MS1601]|uniref:hypothetical protein n=1 Tax=Mycobacterium sp. MS1601 TaxID=1936029 RepID=UPI000979523B|nr:hypothetical protein [Mycobacterium sp. MS1601]AQA03031.1 hypothetical protein BVC93_11965 [Mycobacterium sp. MS1601]
MSYRHQILRNLKFGALPEFVAAEKEKNALRIAAGLTPYDIWAPAFGGLHHMVLEARFESMAAFEAEHVAGKSLEGMAALNARQLACVIEGTANDRLQRITLDATR